MAMEPSGSNRGGEILTHGLPISEKKNSLLCGVGVLVVDDDADDTTDVESRIINTQF
jgi:hypothetical protein